MIVGGVWRCVYNNRCTGTKWKKRENSVKPLENSCRREEWSKASGKVSSTPSDYISWFVGAVASK